MADATLWKLSDTDGADAARKFKGSTTLGGTSVDEEFLKGLDLSKFGDSATGIERLIAAVGAKHGLKQVFSILITTELLKTAMNTGYMQKPTTENWLPYATAFINVHEIIFNRIPEGAAPV